MKSRYGDAWYKDVDGWLKWSSQCLVMERDFNTKAGLSPVDTLPKFMLEESLEEATDIQWDFDSAELQTFWNEI